MAEQFKLTSELIDQIIFAMENQKESFLLDTETLILSTRSSADESRKDFLLPVPDWTPSDGYHLMDSFAGTLKNPIYRERLHEILNSGRGVFRGFKNVLKERDDLENAWFLHKDREMKKRVRNWYSDLCDYWGIESLGEEPEETDDLFLDEFSMELFSADDEMFEQVRVSFREELYKESPEGLKTMLLRHHYHPQRSADLAVKAMSPEGSSCGFISIYLDTEKDKIYAALDCLYVLPEYRGAGIAAGLLDYLLDHCYHNRVETLLLILPPEGEVLGKTLERRGFKAIGPCLLLNLEQWFYEQQNIS
ncbi:MULTISPECIES: N-acetyltransferase [unclassified Oceanispirochaeta]|uniref:GNAT family N-acetyltransferase n=1 Tax=unclassified Oceanispirochaeta TaxID=2635722 RepID=UPI000E096B1C|nr:GNAT family N-acetyltransferase [Oceanispirochaeta sp. M1]MBF9014204.1 GNAT family N-acetyltransferase [Oceanispirochaeta sp. M2]NPD70694.1 GNAT family N-acetyltransferase [Oceanispirochaeta sp. M1]RDG34454.1 GNAT family N-acetyltransferase [Oceanispirochaeta sp. M1]